MKCPFCKRNSGIHPMPQVHLVVTIPKNGRPHVHGPINDQEWMVHIIKTICEASKLDIKEVLEEIEGDKILQLADAQAMQ